MRQCNNDVNNNYCYSAFGLRIDSEVVLPELPIVAGNAADVRIRYGDARDKLDFSLNEGYDYQAAAGSFLFRVDRVASYSITNGEEIVVRPCNQASFRMIRLYLLGTVMGVLLMQRGLLPIHGSTVVINGCGVIFTGISGAGKSTMAAALHKKGYPLLADDVSAIICDPNGIFWVNPGYPQQKLWQASAAMMGIDTAAFDRVCEDKDKYAVPVAAGFRRSPVPVAAVYEIVVKPCADVSIVPLKGAAKLTTIMGNTYRGEFINGLGMQVTHFKQCAHLIKQVQAFRLTRPELGISLDRQIEILLQHNKQSFAADETGRFYHLA
ncbi:hypothetical protein [Sporomusa acidovorans]|uniref:HPr kinase/phosphorylase C-terminal domain-containing protein n=1 Tax=Sporomusa acidovorans (strain ATCC 49682 / DSM 3132 / Mol) TaxID=1123286 RepID=A0ABZ3IYL4_SPOA4|nr:hypothetical protein [Sporomusa acidovorans]OZC17246.1 HPr kinase/phosphorylase [Sporomusa acidovorans DSM 3132]SDF15646.1 HPr Serine kinase C-terminal domain-containing protein [Sporomusa acidovorans]